MQLFSLRKIFRTSTLLLIICLTSSNALTKVINEFKACLESNGLNTTSMFVLQNNNCARYNSLNYQWNTISPQVFPLAYIVPKSTEDVQNAIRCGRATNVRIFPKSGGHSYAKYSFGDSHSVVLDLRSLSKITVNRKDKTAQIGSGALLANVFLTLWTNGKFGIPAASCTSVGIGGVTLGGGYGFWTKRFGLTADNVIGMNFVDPKGNHLKLNRENHADLFWALLGGGSGNFGIVTKFEFKLFDAAALNVKQIVFTFDVNLVEQVFSAYQSWNYEHRNGNAYIGMTVTQTDITVKIIDTDLSDAVVGKIIGSFPTQTLRPVSIKSMNFIELTAENSTPDAKAPEELMKVTQTSISKHGYTAKSYFSSKILSRTEIVQLKSSLCSVPSGIFLQFGSFGGVANRIPKNETSFFHRDSLYLIQVGITPPDRQPKIKLQQQKWLAEFEKIVAILDNGESYQNYVDVELKNDFLQRYYGDNLSRLVEIKTRIDPDNYFAYDQSIPLTKKCKMNF